MNKYSIIVLLILIIICERMTAGEIVLANTDSEYTSFSRNMVFHDIIRAYIDPGSAGFIITTVLGFIAAVGYTIRLYFHRLKGIFSSGNRRGNETEEASAQRDREDGLPS